MHINIKREHDIVCVCIMRVYSVRVCDCDNAMRKMLCVCCLLSVLSCLATGTAAIFNS